MKWISKVALICIVPIISWAGNERREFYNGTRYLGMGDTTVAIVNDEAALPLNPAALGRIRDFYGTFFDPELEFNRGAQDMYRVQPFTQPFSLPTVMPTVVASPNTYYHARGQIMPSFVARNFGIGFLMKYNLDAEANTAGTSVDTFYRDDFAVLMGYNLRLFDGRIKIGFTGKLISRIEIVKEDFDPNGSLDISTLGSSGIAKEGVGVGIDAGLILAAPWSYIPTISAVVRDVGGTSFDKAYGNRLSTSTERPATVSQDIDVGLAWFPIHTRRANFRSSWVLEYRGLLTAQNETDKAKLIHAGIEFNIGDILFIRGGYNQRYWTGGFELSSEKFQFQLATYGEEIGTVDVPREDRRYVGKISLRF